MPRDPDIVNDRNNPEPRDPLEVSLAQLEPTVPALNRDVLMFEAGAASRTPIIRLWQAAAGFMAAFGFAAGIYSRSPSPVDQPTVSQTSQTNEKITSHKVSLRDENR